MSDRQDGQADGSHGSEATTSRFQEILGELGAGPHDRDPIPDGVSPQQRRLGAPPASSLDPPGTTPHPDDPTDPDEQAQDLELPGCAGDVLTLLCNECGHKHPVPTTCDRRTCPYCAQRRYKELVAGYAHLQERLEDPKFLTLTLRAGDDPEALVDRIIEAFGKLRRRAIFEEQRGGFYAVECKPPTEEHPGWNVHLHALVDGPYIPQAELARVWKELTGDSYVVDVRWCRKPSAAVAYILGYTTKGSKVAETWGDVDGQTRRRYEEAVKDRRLVQTFGHLHGVQPADRPFRCPACGGASWTVVEFDPVLAAEVETFDVREFRDREPPDSVDGVG